MRDYNEQSDDAFGVSNHAPCCASLSRSASTAHQGTRQTQQAQVVPRTIEGAQFLDGVSILLLLAGGFVVYACCLAWRDRCNHLFDNDDDPVSGDDVW